MDNLAAGPAALPRQHPREDRRRARRPGKGGTVEKLQETIDDITDRPRQDRRSPKERPRGPSSSRPQPTMGLPGFTSWLGPIVGPLGTAGLVVAMVIFMLLERRDLRDRLIGLFGQGHLAVTTRAFDEAGDARQPATADAVAGQRASTASPPASACTVLGVPYALVWATLGAALRFIPYLGPVLGAGAPILVSLAALPGWAGPLGVVGVVRRARAVHQPRARNRALCRRRRRVSGGAARLAGVLDVAVGTARPADGHAADRVPGRARQARARPRVRRDADGGHAGARRRITATTSVCSLAIQSEAADLIERHIKTEPRAIASTTRCCCRRSTTPSAIAWSSGCRRRKRRPSSMRPASCWRMSAASIASRVIPTAAPAGGASRAEPREPLRVLGYAANGAADELALAMLAPSSSRICRSSIEVHAARAACGRSGGAGAGRRASRSICIADLPPSPPSKTRYLVKRLHAALPEVRIVMGRWSSGGAGRREHAGCCARPARAWSPRRWRRPGCIWRDSSKPLSPVAPRRCGTPGLTTS